MLLFFRLRIADEPVNVSEHADMTVNKVNSWQQCVSQVPWRRNL